MEEHSINIINISAILLAAYLGGLASKKIGFPSILGELTVGIILGPGLLGLLELTESVKVLSEIGIILLMVYIGMEKNFHDLKKASWPGFLAAFGGFFVPFTLGYLAIVLTGGTPLAGLFVAIAIGVTSLATKSRILVDLKLLDTRIAYVLMAGALISDTLALVIFSGITNFAESSSLNIKGLAFIGGKIIAFFLITIGIGIYILPRFSNFISKLNGNNSTLYFTLILIITFGYCELAELAGMHNILGAFMAGLFLKDNLFKKNISKELHKALYNISIGFMAPIFFVSAGLAVDISVFKTDLGLLLLITFLAIFGKIIGTVLFYLPSRNGWREGVAIGTGMNSRGAVEIIIAGIGLEMGIIDQKIFSILEFMVIFTTLTVPVLLKLTTQWLRNRGELIYLTEKNGVLILGVNSISFFIANHLRKHNPITFIDNNMELVSEARKRGYNCIYGSILNPEFISDSVPMNTDSFIGLTQNSQINLDGGLLVQEAVQANKLTMVVSQKDYQQNTKILNDNHIKTAPLWTSQIEEWSQNIQVKCISETTRIAESNSSCQDWIDHHEIDSVNKLPIIIENKEGKFRLFHREDHIRQGEKIILLEKLG